MSYEKTPVQKLLPLNNMSMHNAQEQQNTTPTTQQNKTPHNTPKQHRKKQYISLQLSLRNPQPSEISLIPVRGEFGRGVFDGRGGAPAVEAVGAEGVGAREDLRDPPVQADGALIREAAVHLRAVGLHAAGG